MIFYALKNGERVYTLEIPLDGLPIHLPDLAKLGVSDFQAHHPEVSLREHEILFGFEHV